MKKNTMRNKIILLFIILTLIVSPFISIIFENNEFKDIIRDTMESKPVALKPTGSYSTIDFTSGFSETDPNNDISVANATHVDTQCIANADAYLYKDYGAGYFGEFDFKLNFNCISVTGKQSAVAVWGVSNALDDFYDQQYVHHNASVFLWTWSDTPPANYLYLGVDNGVAQSIQNMAITAGTEYYVRVERSDTKIYARVYTNKAFTGTFTNLSVTFSATTYRYLFAVNSWNVGQAQDGDWDIDNMQLGSNATAWTNQLPLAKGEHPTNGSTNQKLKLAVGCTVSDSNTNHTMNATFATNSSGGVWRNYQTNSSLTNNSKINWTFNPAGTGATKYWWRVYVHDGFANRTFTYSYTTAANETGDSNFSVNYSVLPFGLKTTVGTNQQVTITSPSLANGSTNVDTSTAYWNITITDPEGNLINWTIETSPDIGNSSANESSGGIKNCSLSGIEYDTTYKVYVNASDTVNKTVVRRWYTFSSEPTATLIVYDILSFGLKTITYGDSPVATPILPINDSTDIDMYPLLILNITDYQSDTFDIQWSTNATGGWTHTNTTCTDGIFIQRATFANESETKYWWSVNIVDSGGYWTNNTFNFATREYSWGNWSDWWEISYLSDKPTAPSPFTAVAYNISVINLTWTKGNNMTHTYVRYSVIDFPTSITNGNLLTNTTNSAYNHSGLPINTTYYYSAWSYNSSTHLFSSNYSTAVAQTQNIPIVETEYVDENYTNATLWGQLLNTGGDPTANCRFQYALYPLEPSITTANKTLIGGYYSQYITGLLPGTLYSWRAVASNTHGTKYDASELFLTRPNGPTSLTATVVGPIIALSWTKGLGADYTVVRGKQGGYPSSPTGDTLLYNGTDTSCNHVGISPGDTWYYRAWSFTTEVGTGQFSGNYSQASGTIINITLISNITASKTLLERDGHYNIGDYQTTISFDLWCGSGWTISKAYSRIYTATGVLAENKTSGFTTSTSGSLKHYSYTYNPSNSLSKTVMGDFDLDIYMKVSNATETYSGNNISDNLFRVYVLDPAYAGESVWSTTLNRVNLTWTNGNYSDKTVVVRKNSSSYPLTPTDGYIVQNSSTLTYFNESALSTRSYSIFSYNLTSHSYSEALNIPWGAIGLRCYNESKPSQTIPYSLEISNKDGTIVYKKTGLSGIHYIDVNNIPYGTNTVFIVDSPGYKQRIYYKDINLNNFYNFSFYLPPSTTQGEVTNDTAGCTLRSYINSINISNSSVDATITLTHTLDEIITVEIYNASLYGTYGGWIMIPESKYTTSTNTVIINQTVLDENTTMARATYYYMYCPTETISTPLYYLRVIETIETEYTEVDRGVEDAIVTIKRYANTTGTYVDVAALLTDANGYCNVYLLPNILYKVNITKSGYYSSISDYIPAPANQYGQTAEKTFRIVYDETSSNPDLWVEDVHTNITYNFEPKGSRFTSGYTFYYNITSSDCKLEWYSMDVYFYNVSSDTTTLMSTQNESDTCGGSLSYTVPNVPGKYTFKCYYKKEGYDIYEFGETGSIISFVVRLKEGLITVPDTVWFLITIVLMIVGMGLCIRYFNTGITTGYIGLGIMGIMLMLKDVTINGFGGWVILGITFLIYTAAVFLWWGR